VDDQTARGDVLWTPPADAWSTSRLGQFTTWLGNRGVNCEDYPTLWQWSVDDPDAFWSKFREYADLGRASGPALSVTTMPGATWFPGSQWNYTEEVLRHDFEGPVVVARSQTREPIEMTMDQLREQVAACRAGLVRLGVSRGDRVAAYLPNIPETVIAFLATASIGAVWTSAPPEFGVQAVIDRFEQVEPTVLFAVVGYDYGDRRIDRDGQLEQIREQLPTLRHTVVVPYPDAVPSEQGVLSWVELLSMPGLQDVYELVPFDHPLYVLYSSGTTGKPKAIVHGHGGIICEHAKALMLHHDLGSGDRFFWFSTTGWMMWNYLVSGLLTGASIVLFDGDPAFPNLLTLWRLAAETGISVLGLSAPYLDACRRADLNPGASIDLRRVRAIGSTGAPLSAAAATWAAHATGSDVQISSISGGTDVCTAFIGSSPLHPVRAGEMSCRTLGAKVEAWDADRKPILDRQGELVITAPMPSMPVGLWGDTDGSRLAATYFNQNPGVWTHGDWITVHADGFCAITGRSDATLNRGGVRLGSAEIYAVLEDVPEVEDSLVVHLEERDELLLFVVLRHDSQLTDELRNRISDILRQSLSPRHAPSRIENVAAIPRTLSGKRVEVPVKRILQGADAETVLGRDTLRDPSALDDFIAIAGGLRS
jgi:acetoacetyl-CoA synthetase